MNTSTTPTYAPIDLSNLNLLLEKLDASILECQSQIESTLDSALSDAQYYSDSIDVLSSDVTTIKSDITTLQTAVKRPQKGLEKLNCIDVDISIAQRDLDLFTSACSILDSCLAVKFHLIQFEDSISEGHLDIAADAISQASALQDLISKQILETHSTLLQCSVTGKVSQRGMLIMEENAVLKEIVMDQISRRQVDLKRILYQIVDNLFCFFPHGVEIVTDPKHCNQQQSEFQQPGNKYPGAREWITGTKTTPLMNGVSLEQLWHALKGTGCLESELQALATSLQHSIIAPLIASSHKVPIGKRLMANTLTPGSSLSPKLMWSWFEADEKSQAVEGNGADGATSIPPLSRVGRSTILLIPVLGSLFEFIAAHFFPGHPEAVESLGSLLYVDLTQTLTAQLSSGPIDEIVLTKLKEFETKLRGLHIIPFDTNALATFANKHDQFLFDSKQTKMLAEVRRLCLAIDPAVVLVGEKAADDTLLQCLEELAQTSSPDSVDALCDRLHYQYRISPLLLPKCYVSRAAYEMVTLIDELLDDVFNRIKQQDVDNGLLDSAVEAIQKAIQLFALLSSSVHRNRLQKDPMSGAVFFSDCLYICRKVLLLLANVGKQIPPFIQSIQSRLTLVHVVPSLRSIQEQVFDSMLEYQRQQILELGNSINNLSNVALDRHYADVEGQIGEVVRFIKGLAGCWVDVLPCFISSKCLGRLIDAFLNCLLNKICGEVPNSSATAYDKQALAHLLSSTRDQLRPVIEIPLATEVDSIVCHSTLWKPFCLFRDLLEADVLEFSAKKREINQFLTVQQVQTILDINERKSCSRHEILQMLAS